ncbi:MAG: ADP-dependent NAD(P)H-hydrate dehydratase / NAD(P)H-hydrate epimerase [Abditibacteriota bacterium]|nr:ADP-dependent NAD(P)H-hydrate dehydratase / NAD(P)H-hydrate epimerase [Abditibacteriota bacterium]
MKIFTAEQIREFDRVAVEEYKIPSIVLMENAALRVVEFLEMKFAPLKGKRVAVLCGKGNNGGDGFAVARHLNAAGCEVWMITLADKTELKGDARINYQSLSGIPRAQLSEVEAEYGFSQRGLFYEVKINDHTQFKLLRMVNFSVVIDALLGTGARGEIKADFTYALVLAQVLGEWKTPLVALDIPSGLDAQSGQAAQVTPQADYTVTFAAPKRGMFVRDGLEKCGEIWIGDIGTPPAQMQQTQTGSNALTRECAQSLLPQRSLDAHKGSAGRAVVIGGSFGMSGAPTLASRAVLRSGAGLCIACLPDKVLPTFAAAFSEATSQPLPCDERGRLIPEAADELPAIWHGTQVVAIGPGISRSQSTLEFVRRVVRECELPLVIDADALYALREIEDDVKARTAPTILTPHPGEMGELMQIEISGVNEDRFGTAIACAAKYNAIVVLKGARSIVASPTGNTWANLTGNPGMATGGSGDVLTGTIAGLLAQTKDAQSATLLGVYAHGLAGDIQYKDHGAGLIAGDIAEALPQALLEIARPLKESPNARLRKLQ